MGASPRWGMTPETEARWCGSDAAGQLELPWGVSSKLHQLAFAFAFEVGDHLRRFTSVLSGCLALRAIKGATWCSQSNESMVRLATYHVSDRKRRSEMSGLKKRTDQNRSETKMLEWRHCRKHHAEVDGAKDWMESCWHGLIMFDHAVMTWSCFVAFPCFSLLFFRSFRGSCWSPEDVSTC